MRLLPVLLGLLLVAAAVLYFALRAPARTETARAAEQAPSVAEHASSTATPALDAPVGGATDARSEALPSELAEPAASSAVATLASTALARSAIVGRFVDARGAPLEGVEVQPLGRDGPPEKSDAEGRFRIAFDTQQASLGRALTLSAKAPRHVAAERDVALELGRETDLGDWRLELGGVLSGRVVDADGGSVADARVLTTRATEVDRDFARRNGLWSDEGETRTDARGEFRLGAVPPGRVRAWASKSRFLNAIGEPLELRAGEELAGLELVLEPEGPGDGLDITVLRPDGSPCPNARVEYEYNGERYGGSGSEDCDAEGRLHFVFRVRTPHDFRAVDRESRHALAFAERVEPGSPPLLLRLGEARQFVIEVVDARGEPVRSFQAQLVDARPDKGDTLGSSLRALPDPPGRTVAVVPPHAFSVRVSAAGFASATLGPFENDTVPELVRAELRALPGLRGRVLAGDRPLAGASVGSARALEGNVVMTVNGFPAERQYPSGGETVSAADGSFALYPKTRGATWVRAELVGHAPAIVGPIEFDPEVGRDGVELVLGLGGTIEGRVLLPGVEEPAGVIVGASCGDGRAQSMRVGSDGSFRFEHLMPGRWLVKRCDAEISPHSTSTSTQRGTSPSGLPWNCVVREGEVTRFDLDLRVDPRPRARGRLAFGGTPIVGWMVIARTEGDVYNPSGRGETDADGRFDVRAPSTGRGTLILQAPGEENGWSTLTVALEWRDAEFVWDRDFAAGRLELARGSASALDGSYRLSWSAPGESASLEIGTPLSPGGTRVFERLPAGTWRLARWENERWLDEGTVELRPNETASARLP
ncbi:MAG: carboxypeptidase regulatory-like domain-containing protein [Planctomycetes bacterium]|nr:carboxypeptidase regulatory-like domain-containing protein [Planctomycetota bacterium]